MDGVFKLERVFPLCYNVKEFVSMKLEGYTDDIEYLLAEIEFMQKPNPLLR